MHDTRKSSIQGRKGKEKKLSALLNILLSPYVLTCTAAQRGIYTYGMGCCIAFSEYKERFTSPNIPIYGCKAYTGMKGYMHTYVRNLIHSGTELFSVEYRVAYSRSSRILNGHMGRKHVQVYCSVQQQRRQPPSAIISLGI